MKFLTKINRNYLLPFAAVLLLVTVAGYFMLRIIMMYGAREKLLTTMYLAERQIKSNGGVPDLDPLIEVTQCAENPGIKPSFSKVTLKNIPEDEDEEYLEYTAAFINAGTWYTVKLRQSVFENEDLISILALTLFVLLSSAFIISFFSTRRMNRTIWSAFERNLREIENYSFRLNREIITERTDIDEFERLNEVITGFTRKLRSDYSLLKEFTENASHEMQTPLTVALLNLEEILQYDIGEEPFKKTVTAINALKRLKSLNQSLILLAKIENRQFESAEEISFDNLLTDKIKEFSSFTAAKGLQVEISTEGDFRVRINEYLSDIMISNLLSNAVNHNIAGGIIRITVKTDSLTICNTGEENKLTNETIFNRFVSGNQKSAGLGLAIVRQICETHNLDIKYMKTTDLHCFTIRIKSKA